MSLLKYLLYSHVSLLLVLTVFKYVSALSTCIHHFYVFLAVVCSMVCNNIGSNLFQNILVFVMLDVTMVELRIPSRSYNLHFVANSQTDF